MNKKKTEIPVRPYINTCEVCSAQFSSDSQNETMCLVHRVLSDLKLPEDTIVNMNIVNLWNAKRFDKAKGADRMLASIAEGVILLDGIPEESRKIYSKLSVVDSTKGNEDIEEFVKKLMDKRKLVYDAVVVLRYNNKSNFHVYGLSYSKRMVKILSKKDTIFKKNYAISLVNNYVLKSIKK